MGGVYLTAREFLERALERARASHDRTEERTIGLRICEVIEQEELNEAMERVAHGNERIESDSWHARTRKRRH